uniref:Uncharacterized protein n=1 Tax=Leersia perrieri TaxID=77586 RepID=A0A0D9XAP9_9ORYZ
MTNNKNYITIKERGADDISCPLEKAYLATYEEEANDAMISNAKNVHESNPALDQSPEQKSCSSLKISDAAL